MKNSYSKNWRMDQKTNHITCSLNSFATYSSKNWSISSFEGCTETENVSVFAWHYYRKIICL